MNSLRWAEMPLIRFILSNIDIEVIAINSKIAFAILKTESYKHFFFPHHYNVTPALEYVSDRINSKNKITLISDKNKPKEMNYYLWS
jgi:hypothetical protein